MNKDKLRSPGTGRREVEACSSKRRWSAPVVIRPTAVSESEKVISDQYGIDAHYDTQTTSPGPS